MKRKVMVVDDEILSLEYTCSLIDWKKEGFELVAQKESVAQAEEVLETMPVDIVIFDVSMPGLTGVDLSLYIKEHHPSVSMLAISGYDNYDYVREILKNGASDYILKHRLTSQSLLQALHEMEVQEKGKRDSGAGTVQTLPNQIQNLLIENLDKSDFLGVERILTKHFEERGAGWRKSSKELLPFFLVYLHRSEHELSSEDFDRFISVSEGLVKDQVAKDYSEHLKEILQPAIQNQYSHYVMEALEFIGKNYQLNIKLNDCASVIGVNASYLSHIFHEETGDSFTTKLNLVRLENAKEMMRENSSMKEIAFACGFKDYSYFFKVFKKENGCTPQQYLETKIVQ
jgi:two-component system response regulator YesN